MGAPSLPSPLGLFLETYRETQSVSSTAIPKPSLSVPLPGDRSPLWSGIPCAGPFSGLRGADLILINSQILESSAQGPVPGSQEGKGRSVYIHV